MNRRVFVTSLAAVLAAPLGVAAQPRARIGYLAMDLTASAHLHEAFRQGLRDLGYVEGRNVVIEYRDAKGKPERFPNLAAELVALNVDVIVSVGTLAGVAVKRATTKIPVVFPTIGDPVADGLVSSLARPGGNFTGLSNLSVELVGKCLQVLKEAVAGVSRVAILNQPGATTQRTETEISERAQAAARALGVAVRLVEVQRAADIDRAFADMTRWRANALVVLPYGTLLNERWRIVALTAKARLAAVYAYKEMVEAGGLLSYGADLADSFRRSANYVDRILKGASPAEMPVEQPTKFDLVINLKTAKALGLTIPPSLLLRADQVIE
jgi:ABC-type uncharacterized transport system substrate-binding protein